MNALPSPPTCLQIQKSCSLFGPKRRFDQSGSVGSAGLTNSVTPPCTRFGYTSDPTKDTLDVSETDELTRGSAGGGCGAARAAAAALTAAMAAALSDNGAAEAGAPAAEGAVAGTAEETVVAAGGSAVVAVVVGAGAGVGPTTGVGT